MAQLARGQTFEVNGQQQQPNTSQQQTKRGGKGAKPSGEGGGLGFGNSIEVARSARAAEQALKRGNYAEAVNFSQKAVQAAPGDKRLWLQLGYAARLAGRYQQSLDAYKHVLDGAQDHVGFGRPVRVAAAEGLILTKLIASRTQDLAD